MLAASLDTSEPEMFMAMPRSARFRAGESLTPSPVLRHKVKQGTITDGRKCLHSNDMSKSLGTLD